MKKFIKRLLLFSSIAIGTLLAFFYVTNRIVMAKTNYKVPETINSLVVGHSHSECAYNDSLISGMKNFSFSGSSYLYNYYALKPLINHNRNIKSVFIEFTNNQIQPYMDDCIWGDKFLPRYMGVLGSYIDKEGLMFLLKKNPGGVLNGLTKQFRQQLKIIFTSKYSYTYNRGGFQYLKRNRVKENIVWQNKVADGENKGISNTNIYYLKKCIEFCRKKNISVYLVRSPMHKLYNNYNEVEFQGVLKTRLSDVDFLDFKDFPLSDAEFGDLGHLNFKGAHKFSVWVNKLLVAGLLKQSNKQKFINDNMNK